MAATAESITELTALTTPAGADLLVIVDDVGGAAEETKKITVANLFGKIPAQLVCIGDDACANMTVGLVINQLGADDSILVLKSSDVDHGMTTMAETDTYGTLSKHEPISGGLKIVGAKDADGAANSALYLEGLLGMAADTTKTTTSRGIVRVGGYIKSGTTVAAAGADANIFTITNGGTTRFIFDAEGSGHSDVEWTTYDDQDDMGLLSALESEFSVRKAVTQEFGKAIGGNRALLQEAGIVNFYDDGPRAMVNWTRLNMLMVGALRQLGMKVQNCERALLRLGVEPRLLEAR